MKEQMRLPKNNLLLVDASRTAVGGVPWGGKNKKRRGLGERD
jgi:hypothetical protein